MSKKIFFSWQSDIPGNTNLVRKALRSVIKIGKHGYTLDEATRDTPGSPNIPQTIKLKIERCDIFVADISTVASREEQKSDGSKIIRHHSNSNVMYELGYANAILGDERSILLAGGSLETLPFDIDRQRVTRIDERLISHLTAAIDTIEKHNPPAQWEQRVAAPAARKIESKATRDLMGILSGDTTSRAIREMIPNQYVLALSHTSDSLSELLGDARVQLPVDMRKLAVKLAVGLEDLTRIASEDFFPASNPDLLRIPKWNERRKGFDTQRVKELAYEIQDAYSKLFFLANQTYPESLVK